ncbi:MAG: PD-(D/E)XK nuclease family protein, partial [Candidatus Eremiobacteraeota bacterium]|nr:PD-(D/E)XK nuclease family protein [Candidatus Eremiobacteraeota bacterium]
PELQRADDSLREEASLWYVALTRARRDVLATAALVDDDGVDTVTSRFCQAIGDVSRAETQRLTVSAAAPRPLNQTPCDPHEPRIPIGRPLTTLAPTDLNVYLACPRKYFYERVLALQPDETDAMRLGIFAHLALQRFHEMERDFSKVHDVAATAQRHAATLQALAEQTASQRATKAGVSENSGLYRYELSRVQRQLTYYAHALAKDAHENPFHVLYCEQLVATDVDGVRVVGRADRIDRLERGGIAVRDYKSGKYKRPGAAATTRALLEAREQARAAGADPNAIFGSMERAISVQMILYLPGVEALAGEPVTCLDYVYLGGKKETGDDSPTVFDRTTVVSRALPVDSRTATAYLTREEIDTALREIAGAMVRELSEDRLTAFPTTLVANNCERCGFRRVCTQTGSVLR